MIYSYRYFMKAKWDSSSFLKNTLCSYERECLKYLFVSPLELVDFWGVPRTLLGSRWPLHVPENDSVHVNSSGGYVLIAGTCPQEALCCLSVCEIHFLYAILQSSWGQYIPGGRFLAANLSFVLLFIDSYRTAQNNILIKAFL